MINVFNRVQQCAFWVGGPNVNFSVFSKKEANEGGKVMKKEEEKKTTEKCVGREKGESN